MKCAAPGCTAEATAWPTVKFGRVDRGPPYRLEIPMAICPAHQDGFRPGDFITPGARARFGEMAEGWGLPAPRFDWFHTDWKSLDDPAFTSMDGSEARFCAPDAT